MSWPTGRAGHSEKSMVAASVIGRQPAAAEFLLSLAGVGLPGLDTMPLQDGSLAQDRGTSPQVVQQLPGYARRWHAIVMAEPNSAAVSRY